MTKTLTVQIGNSDNKLTQEEWSQFVEEVGKAIVWRTPDVFFHGCSHGAARWQNACWVFDVEPEPSKYLRDDLQALAGKYRQDGIAVTVGETMFVTP